jgi:hypothetical protein
MRPRFPILSLLAAALFLVSAASAQALCHCRYRTYRSAYYRPAYHYSYYRPVYRSARYGSAWIKTDVEPDEARVYVDGRLVGTADDFDGFPRMLRVSPGTHRLTFRLSGYAPYTVVVRALPGRVVDIDRWLRS